MHSSGPVGRHRQLVLVLEGELYLIPFALLKGSSSNEYLYERFALIAVPSIRSLGPQSKVSLAGAAGAPLWAPEPALWSPSVQEGGRWAALLPPDCSVLSQEATTCHFSENVFAVTTGL